MIRHQRKAMIYSFGSCSAYPFQINTSHLPLFQRVRCIVGYLFRNQDLQPDNYYDWCIKSIGKGFARTFLIPYSEKFWHFSTREMTFEWTNDRVPIPKPMDVIKGAFKDQIVKVGTNPTFQYTAEHGAGFTAIPAGIASQTQNIHLGMEATSINLRQKTITFNHGETTLEFEQLISTIPLPELIKMLDDVPDRIKHFTEQLKHNSIAVINLGINRPQLNPNHWIHYPEKDISFFRISFPNNFGHGLSPENTSMIQAEVNYNPQHPPVEADLVEAVHKDLIKTGILLPEDKIIFNDVLFIKYAYVIYDKLRKEAVKNIHDFLHENSIYPCGRYGEWAYLWSDESAMSGKKTAEKFLQPTTKL
jgi:UDP-galactopyranose mutase